MMPLLRLKRHMVAISLDQAWSVSPSCRLDDGGAQERILSGRYRGWAEAFATEWPRTSAVLVRIAEKYEHLGKFQDEHSEQFDW